MCLISYYDKYDKRKKLATPPLNSFKGFYELRENEKAFVKLKRLAQQFKNLLCWAVDYSASFERGEVVFLFQQLFSF